LQVSSPLAFRGQRPTIHIHPYPSISIHPCSPLQLLSAVFLRAKVIAPRTRG
jgi:hypothetical protein